jgi:hypothetical protein
VIFFFLFFFFWVRVLGTICWLQTTILLISASREARITGVSHQCLAFLHICSQFSFPYFQLLFNFLQKSITLNFSLSRSSHPLIHDNKSLQSYLYWYLGSLSLFFWSLKNKYFPPNSNLRLILYVQWRRKDQEGKSHVSAQGLCSIIYFQPNWYIQPLTLLISAIWPKIYSNEFHYLKRRSHFILYPFTQQPFPS